MRSLWWANVQCDFTEDRDMGPIIVQVGHVWPVCTMWVKQCRG